MIDWMLVKRFLLLILVFCNPHTILKVLSGAFVAFNAAVLSCAFFCYLSIYISELRPVVYTLQIHYLLNAFIFALLITTVAFFAVHDAQIKYDVNYYLGVFHASERGLRIIPLIVLFICIDAIYFFAVHSFTVRLIKKSWSNFGTQTLTTKKDAETMLIIKMIEVSFTYSAFVIYCAMVYSFVYSLMEKYLMRYTKYRDLYSIYSHYCEKLNVKIFGDTSKELMEKIEALEREIEPKVKEVETDFMNTVRSKEYQDLRKRSQQNIGNASINF